MATEYSLLTWAGLGTTVTFTDTGDIVNFTAHGAPNGHAFRFTTTGTLPTGLTAGTTYYLGAGADANKFLVYPTSADAIAGTNQVTFSGTGSGTHKVVGEYWAALPATDPGNGGNYKARYGTAGSERVYGNTYALRTSLFANRDASKSIYIEIQGRWIDSSVYYLQAGGSWRFTGYFAVTIATIVNGVRDIDSFHFGVPGAGWQWVNSVDYFYGLSSDNSRTIIDGVEVINLHTATDRYNIQIGGALSCVKNCLCKSVYARAFSDAGAANQMFNNIAYGSAYGFTANGYSGAASLIYNNLAVGCSYGFVSNSASSNSYINNISIGNTTNWSGTLNALGRYANNGGASGDTIWTSSGETSITGLTTSIFNDYAGNDFTYVDGSAVINAGSSFYDLLDNTDLLGATRPNYEATTFPNNVRDLGPFEYDHGEGLAPSSVPISITGMVSGSEIAIYKASDMSAILAPQSTTGLYSGTYTYTGDTNIIVRVRKGTAAIRYLPYEYAGTITSTGFQLVVSQIPDTIA